MTAIHFLEQTASWVWRTSWQAAILVALILLVQWLFGRKLAPGWRYSLWLLVVIRLVLPVTPQSPVSVFNWISTRAPAEAEASFRPGLGFDFASGDQVSPAKSNLLPSSPAPQQVQSAAVSSQSILTLTTQAILGLIWLSGAVMFISVLARQYWKLNRLLSNATRVTDFSTAKTLEEAWRTTGLKRVPDLLETEHVGSPALFGFFRIRLLLPKGLASSLTTEELRHIFLHEAAHLKRGDLWLNWMVTILQVLHWFNPVLWFGFSRMRADRELACDALALSHAKEGEERTYAQTIIKLLEGCAQPKSLPGLVGILEDKNQMKRRITMIAKFKSAGRWSITASSLILGLGLVALTDAQDKSLDSAERIIEKIRRLGGKVAFAEGLGSGGVHRVSFEVYSDDYNDFYPFPKVTDDLLRDICELLDLRELNLSGAEVTDGGLVHLKNLKKLEKLNLSGTGITDDGLSQLTDLTHLRVLALASTLVGDSGLMYLNSLEKLEDLDISATRVTDAGLKQMSSSSQLRSLTIRSGMTDAGLAAVKKFLLLEKLNVSRSKITDAGLINLAELETLRELNLWGCRKVTDAGVEKLSGLEELQTLVLTRTGVTERSLQTIQHFDNITRLGLGYMHGPITEAGMLPIQALTKLSHLALDGTQVTSDSLAQLAELKELRTLSLRLTKIDDTGLEHIAALPNLEALYLDGARRITEVSLNSMISIRTLKELHLAGIQLGKSGLQKLKQLPQLDFLKISLTAPEITDADLYHLKDLPALRVLDLHETKITDAGLVHLGSLTKLEYLTLWKTGVTDSGLVNLRGLHRLYELDLGETRVTGKGFSFLEGLTNLQYLELSGSPITDEGLAQVAKLTNIALLYLDRTQITDEGLRRLSSLSKLRDLELDDTEISEAGLAHLRRLTYLTDLSLKGTKVTEVEAKRFQEEMPSVEVVF